jgi:hypothetical protein
MNAVNITYSVELLAVSYTGFGNLKFHSGPVDVIQVAMLCKQSTVCLFLPLVSEILS